MEGYRPLSASEGLVEITHPFEVKIAEMRPRTTKRSVTIAVLLFLSKDKKYIEYVELTRTCYGTALDH